MPHDCLHQSFRLRIPAGIRNRTLLLMNYLLPLGFYLMMGFVMPEINPEFRAVLVPAMVVFAILAATLLGLPDPLVNAREAGIFRSYKINGVPSDLHLAHSSPNDHASPRHRDTHHRADGAYAV